MTDIRPIRKSEAEPFLELLCTVFSLDYHRAYDVFFTEPLFDLNRKWALFEGRDILSILTTTPLNFGWGRAMGIAGVATRKDRQGEGLASHLLQKVLTDGEKRGETGSLLFARTVELYEKNGFEAIDRVVRGKIECVDRLDNRVLETEEVELIYDAWSVLHDDRLRRDAARWRYWKWNYRVAAEFGDGYVCHESGTLREALFNPAVAPGPLPLPEQTEWLGTTFMADQLGLTIQEPVVDLYLMGRNIPGIPQLFMTDQF